MFQSTRWRALLVGAAAVGMATIGTPSTAATAPTPFAVTGTHTITLITGDQVTVRTANGKPIYQTRSSSGFASFSDGTGDHYVVPSIALPYLGKQLDRSLFDVSALDRDGVTGKLPVHLSFGAGVTPTALAGVTFTLVSGSTADGYLASGSAFTAALRKRIGADIAAGRQAGASGIADGLAGINLAAAGAPGPVVRPFFPLHILQINATDLTGQPASTFALLTNTDSSARLNDFVPMIGGIARIAVPAGNYAAVTFFDDFDAQGNPTAFRLVTANDFVVADTPAVTTLALDERTATSAISASAPRPAIQDVIVASTERFDANGNAASAASQSNSGMSTAPVEVNPQPEAKVGTLHYLVQWGGAATKPGDNYRFDLAFGSSDIPADETFVGRADQVAAVHEHLFADPAGGPTGQLSSGALDPLTFGFELVGPEQPMPADLVDYLGTADGGEWLQFDLTPNDLELFGDPHTYAAGHDYSVDWARGPLTAGLTHWTGPQFCDACTAGSTLSLAIPIVRDTVPDHAGDFPFFIPVAVHFTLFRDNTKLFDQDGFFGAAVTDIPATPSTYRGVLDVDLSAANTFSQSTKTHTEVTVKYSPTATGSPLPTTDACESPTPTTPCQILPALTLDYQLAADESNTSHSPVQTMGLQVGHVSYNGVGSHSPITSATVSVSFDNGTTWHPATVAGFAGHYFALWRNPASGSPTLRVTATDAAGDAVTQTITNAYTIGNVGAGR
jgi:hypothetical protein